VSIALFDKWLAEGSSAAAVEWVKKLASSDLPREQVAAGWCLAQLIKEGKLGLYLEVLRERQSRDQVREYVDIVGTFLLR
jgi:hypothetical protein